MPTRRIAACVFAAWCCVSPAGAGNLRTPEDRLEAEVVAYARDRHGLELHTEESLRDVARQHSRALAHDLQIETQDFVRLALSASGLLDPFPYIYFGSTLDGGIGQLEHELRRILDELPAGERRLYTHVACGAVRVDARSRWWRREKRWYITVLLSQRAITYASLPEEIRPGDRCLFEGEIHAPFREPRVLLTAPNGHTQELDSFSNEAQRFRTYLSFDAGAGEYQLEVLGRYDMGPRVLALASLDARLPGEVGLLEKALLAARRSGGDASVATNPVSIANEDDAEARLLELVNRDRRRAGVQPLAPQPALAAMARAHSVDMRDNRFFAHVSPSTGRLVERATAAGVRYRRLAENIALNRDVDEAQEALLRSPGHRMNILGPDFTHVGFGVAFDVDARGNRRVYVTQAFLLP